MPVPSGVLVLLPPLLGLLAAPGGLLAYVGLGPGQEFIPYFLALLAWAGAAFLAVLQWPLVALYRRLSRSRAARDETGPSKSEIQDPQSEVENPQSETK
jgi:hypothetical protein